MNTSAQAINDKSQVHTVYRLKSGARVPSVTTALRTLNKPALIPWAWGLGAKGIDWEDYRDEMADIGTLTHYLILCHLKGTKPSTNAYSADQIDLAENCFLKYLEWERGKVIEPILLETPLVSEKWRYGGTPDLFGRVDGVLSLVDFKTSKGIYPEFWFQVAAYAVLLQDNGYIAEIDDIGQFMILNIGRDESERYVEERLAADGIDTGWQIFFHALRIYELRKLVKERKK